MTFLPKAAAPLIAALIPLLVSTLPVASESPDGSGNMRALGRCEGCVFDGRDFSRQTLTGIDLSEADLQNVTFDMSRLNLAVFENAVLSNVSFAGANLRGTNFVGARLSDVSFEGADLRGAVFEGASLERTSLDEALLCNTQTPSDRMDNSDCDGEQN